MEIGRFGTSRGAIAEAAGVPPREHAGGSTKFDAAGMEESDVEATSDALRQKCTPRCCLGLESGVYTILRVAVKWGAPQKRRDFAPGKRGNPPRDTKLEDVGGDEL